jgi:DNA-binding MarR family transcriptional regulator
MSSKPRKTNTGPESVPVDAREAWTLMLDLVLAHERRRRVTEELGMSFGLVRAIRRLARQPMSMGELADALGIERPNATVLVDDLESRGLARRRPHPSDRRAKVVEATPKGTRRGRRAEEILATPPPALSALDRKDLATLRRILTEASAGDVSDAEYETAPDG